MRDATRAGSDTGDGQSYDSSWAASRESSNRCRTADCSWWCPPRSHRKCASPTAGALSDDAGASESWKKLAPAVRRGYVKSVLDAKKAETRAGRIVKIVETLRHGVPARRTWTPPPR
jgi:Bacteriocin-protection, YdeI or OmpD-Associated